jgi:uroporphyrinogen-III decarboxylase
MVRKALGPGFPVIQTVFSPATVLTYLLAADQTQRGPRLQAVLQDHPRLARRALLAIAETYSTFAREAIAAGADGIFFSIKPARPDYLTEEQYMSFCLADDRSILLRAVGGWFNVLHLCGPNAYFEAIKRLPCDAVSYGLAPGNPLLSEVRDRYRKAVIGGVSSSLQLLNLTPAQVRDEVSAALRDTSGKGFILGAGCSIPPAAPDDLVLQARHALLAWAHASPAG